MSLQVVFTVELHNILYFHQVKLGGVKFIWNLACLRIFLLYLHILLISWLGIKIFFKLKIFLHCFPASSIIDDKSKTILILDPLLIPGLVFLFVNLWYLLFVSSVLKLNDMSWLDLFLSNVLGTWWALSIWKFMSFILGIFSWIISYDMYIEPPDLVLNQFLYLLTCVLFIFGYSFSEVQINFNFYPFYWVYYFWYHVLISVCSLSIALYSCFIDAISSFISLRLLK